MHTDTLCQKMKMNLSISSKETLIKYRVNIDNLELLDTQIKLLSEF